MDIGQQCRIAEEFVTMVPSEKELEFDTSDGMAYQINAIDQRRFYGKNYRNDNQHAQQMWKIPALVRLRITIPVSIQTDKTINALVDTGAENREIKNISYYIFIKKK